MNNTINGRTPEEIKNGLKCDEIGDCTNTICPYFPEKDCLHSRHFDVFALINRLQEDKKQLERERDEAWKVVDGLNTQIEGTAKVLESMKRKYSKACKERDAAMRTARWQFERRGKDGVTELPVCSGCGATPKYYVPKNDVGMQVPPYCHECGSKMAAVVKMEVE